MPQSTSEAKRWWNKAAAQGHAAAKANLAITKDVQDTHPDNNIPVTPNTGQNGLNMTREGLTNKRVQVKGIISKPELNGINGVIVKTLNGADGSMRCVVKLDGDRGLVNVKGSNLVMAIQIRR